MLNDKRCENCYYHNSCPECDVCEDYTPIDAHHIEFEIDKSIETGRIEFRSIWFEYIEQFND